MLAREITSMSHSNLIGIIGLAHAPNNFRPASGSKHGRPGLLHSIAASADKAMPIFRDR
jgi:hypothetical protein